MSRTTPLLLLSLFLLWSAGEGESDARRGRMAQIGRLVERVRGARDVMSQDKLQILLKQLRQLKKQIQQSKDQKSGPSSLVSYIEYPPAGFQPTTDSSQQQSTLYYSDVGSLDQHQPQRQGQPWEHQHPASQSSHSSSAALSGHNTGSMQFDITDISAHNGGYSANDHAQEFGPPKNTFQVYDKPKYNRKPNGVSIKTSHETNSWLNGNSLQTTDTYSGRPNDASSNEGYGPPRGITLPANRYGPPKDTIATSYGPPKDTIATSYANSPSMQHVDGKPSSWPEAVIATDVEGPAGREGTDFQDNFLSDIVFQQSFSSGFQPQEHHQLSPNIQHIIHQALHPSSSDQHRQRQVPAASEAPAVQLAFLQSQQLLHRPDEQLLTQSDLELPHSQSTVHVSAPAGDMQPPADPQQTPHNEHSGRTPGVSYKPQEHETEIHHEEEHPPSDHQADVTEFGPPRFKGSAELHHSHPVHLHHDVRPHLPSLSAGLNHVKHVLLPEDLSLFAVPAHLQHLQHLHHQQLLPSPAGLLRRLVRRIRAALRIGTPLTPGNYYQLSAGALHCRCVNRDMVLGLLVAGVTAAALASYSSYLAANSALSRQGAARQEHTKARTMLEQGCLLAERVELLWNQTNIEKVSHQPEPDHMLQGLKQNIVRFADEWNGIFDDREQLDDPISYTNFSNSDQDIEHFWKKLVSKVSMKNNWLKNYILKATLKNSGNILNDMFGVDVRSTALSALRHVDLNSLQDAAEVFQSEMSSIDRTGKQANTAIIRVRAAMRVVRRFFLIGIPRSLQAMVYDTNCGCITLRLESISMIGGPIFIIVIATGLLGLLMIQYGVTNNTFGRIRSEDAGFAVGDLPNLLQHVLQMEFSDEGDDQSVASALSKYYPAVKHAVTEGLPTLTATALTSIDCGRYYMCHVTMRAAAAGHRQQLAASLMGLPMSWMLSEVQGGSIGQYCRSAVVGSQALGDCSRLYPHCSNAV